MTESNTSDKSLPAIELAGAVELEAWRKANGICRTTAWNWRQTGKLQVIYRYGRAYVSAEQSRRLLEKGTVANSNCR